MDTDSFVFQKARIEGARQQLGDMKLLTLSLEICEDDRYAFRKFPNDLPASATRRRQRLRVSHDSQFRKLSFTFRQRFPDRDAFGANRQTIARALDIASGVNLPVSRLHCRPDLEI